MNWSSHNDYIPIFGAIANLILVVWVVCRESISFRRGALIAVILISAISIALYWSDAPEVAANGSPTHLKPPLLAYIGIWTMKLKVMIAGIGITMLNRFSDYVLRPIFYSLVLLSGLVITLMVAALPVT